MRTSMLRTTGTTAISNPTLANIEKRWEVMPPQEQADLWMALRDRMKVDWTQMTLQEKKAGMSTFCHEARTRPIGELSYVSYAC
jgi:cytochrome c oxidase subunit 4